MADRAWKANLHSIYLEQAVLSLGSLNMSRGGVVVDISKSEMHRHFKFGIKKKEVLLVRRCFCMQKGIK